MIPLGRLVGRLVGRLAALSSAVVLFAATPGQAQSIVPGMGWNGPYIGVNAGGVRSDLEAADSSDDVVWSGHAGYGLKFSRYYFGIEADVTFGGSETTSDITPIYSSTLSAEWSSSVRARVGYAIGTIMPYMTGGFAWSRQSVVVHSLGAELSSSTSTVTGTVFGAGIEAIVLPKLSLRVEALRYDYSKQDPSVLDAIPPAGLGKFRDLGREDVVIRAGASLRF